MVHVLKNLGSTPDLSHLSWLERNQRWRQANWRAFFHWETWLGMAVLMLIAWVGFWLGTMMGSLFWGGVIGGGVGGLCFGLCAKAVVLTYHRDVLVGERMEHG